MTEMSGCTCVALTASADWKRHRKLCFGHCRYHNPAAYTFYLRKSAALGKRGHGSDKVFAWGRQRASLLVWVDTANTTFKTPHPRCPRVPAAQPPTSDTHIAIV